MPLRSIRPNRSERDLKRRSTLDPTNFFRRADKDSRFSKSTDNLDSSRIAASEDGYRPKSSDMARPSTGYHDDPPPSPPVQEHTPNTRRFSLMRFRHASDSQLSARAKEQAQHQHQHHDDQAPPVPAVPAVPAMPAVPATPASTYKANRPSSSCPPTDVEPVNSARHRHDRARRHRAGRG